MQWTSLEAYHSIYGDLPERRQQVLRMVLAYVEENGLSPTGQELEQFAKIKGLEGSVQPNKFKRLSELADLVNAIHRDDVRYCSFTGNLAITWTPGPIPGTEIGEPQPDPRLVKRLAMLKEVAPQVSYNQAQFILNVTEKRLDLVWTESVEAV